MASSGSIFHTMQPSLAEVEAAVAKVNNLITAKKLSKKPIFEMLAGFRTIEHGIQHKETKAYELAISWLRLYLKMHSNIDAKDTKLCAQFEKTVPPAMTYIIGCLQYKTMEMHNFHYQLLELVHEILKRVRPEVVEKLATFEMGIIACLWFPIDFVGDFNTQMLALRLLVLLLKCVDSVRRQHELDRIRCAQTHALRDKLSTVIAVANYHAGKFENTARELLNSYNMNMAQNVLVYSLRCKSFKLSGKYEFIKPLNAEDFWIDLNYCPRTLTFNGRYKAKEQSRYTNCAVALNVLKMSLNADKLTVRFQAPAVFSKKLRGMPSVNEITMAELLLPRDEAMRLRENNFVLKYYNNKTQINHEINSDASSDLDESYHSDNTMNASNKENVPPTNAASNTFKNSTASVATVRNQANKVIAASQSASVNNFPKSYNFLVGQTSNAANNEMDTTTDTDFIAASQSTTHSVALSSVKKRALAAAADLSKSTIAETTLPTHKRTTADKECDDAVQLIRKPRQKRFFKTRRVSSDTDFSPRTHIKLHNRRSKRRKRKVGGANAALPKRKQINKVKPMTHFPLPNDSNVPNNEASRTTDQSAIINITNFLGNGNESAAVFNQLQRRTIVENVERAFAAGVAAPAHAARPTADMYENRMISDAEAGQSYRNFRTRRLLDNQPEVAETNKRRTRQTMQRSAKFKQPLSPQQLIVAAVTEMQLTPKLTRKRSSAKAKKLFHMAKDGDVAAPPAAKSLCLTTERNTIGKNKNRTVYSADIEIDLTCTPTTINVAAAPTEQHDSQIVQKISQQFSETSERQMYTNVQHTPINLPIKASQPQRNDDAIIKCDGLSQIGEYEYQQIAPSLCSNTKDVIAVADADIEPCRHDVPTNLSTISPLQNINEFSDDESPTIPNMMSISDFLQLTDNESTKSMNLPQTLKANESNSTPQFKSTEFTTESRQFTKPNECILYHQRSECDSDSDHNDTYDSFDETNIPAHLIQTPRVPPTNFRPTSKCCVTTTATAIITHQDGVISQQVVVNVAVPPDAQVNATTAHTESRNEQSPANASLVGPDADFDNMLACIRQPSEEYMAVMPSVLQLESSNMLMMYKNAISSHLANVRERFKDKQTATYIRKVSDIGERMTDEIERERKEILDLEGNIERISRQLDWQFDAYQRKLKQFECFKQNIDNVVKVLSDIDITKKVEIERERILQELQHTSRDLRSKQWRNFINDSTESLLKNITTLSNI